MNKLKSSLVLAVLASLISVPYLHAQMISAEVLGGATVFLHQDHPEIRVINGKPHEVWIRGTNEPKPKLSTIRHTGTGFFVAKDNVPYLLTAGHVASKINQHGFVVMRSKGDRPISISMSRLLGTNAPPQWVRHDHADLAVLKLDPSPELVAKHLQKRFLPFSMLLGDLHSPVRDLELTVFGFPKGLGVTGHFSPLTMHSRASSGLLQLQGPNGKRSTYFVLEKPGIGGYSGAPVFDTSVYKHGLMTSTGSRTKCYGLMKGTISDETGGKLAVVVPSAFLAETIAKAEKNPETGKTSNK